MDVVHETLVFTERFDVPVGRLFRAFTDPREREKWGAPNDTAEVRIDESDMRTGGKETGRCGTRGAMQYSTYVLYHVVERDACIVYSETVREADVVLHAALVTVEFDNPGMGASVKITDQVASFVGREGLDGHRLGYAAALKNLEEHLRAA